MDSRGHSRSATATSELSSKGQRWRWLAAGIVLLATAGAINWGIARLKAVKPIKPTTAFFSPKLIRSVKFPLYYPLRLPAGYAVDRQSLTTKDGAVIFGIKSPTGKTIAVTQQSLPTDVTLNQLNPSPVKIQGEKDFQTAAGRAHLGLWGANYVCNIVANGTWIILNVNGLTADQATLVAQAFAKIDY